MTNRTNLKHRSSWGFFIVLAAVAGAGGVVLATRWQEAVALRTELELARMDAGELVRLRAENATLKGRQISAAELEALRADHAALPRLRADHAALPRLRAEIEALKKGLGPTRR